VALTSFYTLSAPRARRTARQGMVEHLLWHS
jgi:hypothetical protein